MKTKAHLEVGHKDQCKVLIAKFEVVFTFGSRRRSLNMVIGEALHHVSGPYLTYIVSYECAHCF